MFNFHISRFGDLSFSCLSVLHVYRERNTGLHSCHSGSLNTTSRPSTNLTISLRRQSSMRNHDFTNVNSELSSKISMLLLFESSSENDTLNSISNGCLSAPHRQTLESHFKYLEKKKKCLCCNLL